MVQAAGFTRAALESLSARYHEPDWVLAQRLAAFERFEQTPYPSTSDEDWRRTDIRDVDFDALSKLPAPNGHGAPAGTEPAEAGLGGLLHLRDGAVVERQLDEQYTAAGVRLLTLHEAIEQHPELVRRWFMTECVRPDEGKFTLMHAAFWTEGVFCYVPQGVTVERPLLARVELIDGSVLHHTLFVVEAGGQASLIDEFQGGAAEALSVPVAEVYAGRDSHVHYSSVQNWEPGVVEFATKRIRLEDNAEASLCLSSLGGSLTKTFVGASLMGPGGSCDLLGLYFPFQGQHVDHTTFQDHRVGNCTSNLLFKGALADEARSVFRGIIDVRADAQRTDAYQTNNNLLLGERARADSMPVLEIQADDVRCSHGATLAHLDDEDLFYLMSRGLPRDVAEHMVITGYFEPVIERIPVEGVRERLHEALERRLVANAAG